jgi:hypothetical protein
MSKHTEGDWWYERNYPNAPEPVDEWVVQCNNGDESEGGRGHDTIAEVYSEADARLIAKAPEMLTMLKRMSDMHGQCLWCGMFYDEPHDKECRLVRLIAKVEGD